MILKITPYNFFGQNNAVNNPKSNTKINNTVNNATQNIAPQSLNFCGSDRFVSTIVKKEALPLSDAISSVFEAISAKTFKEIELPIANPNPLEIFLENLAIKASKNDGNVSVELAYHNKNAQGSIPIPTNEVMASGFSPKSRTSLIDSIKNMLIDESDEIRFDRTKRMDDLD